MQEKLVEIIEDLGKGIDMEQLAQKPLKGEVNKDGDRKPNSKKDA